jgi:serine/threonine protein kinase
MIINQMAIDDIVICTPGFVEVVKFVDMRSIIRRDIKPGNIMFDLAGQRFSVADWSLAECYSSE